jgi:hypothetical protein
VNDFERDNEWQRGIRDAILLPKFYGSYAVERRYVVLDKGQLASVLQKRAAVDTIVQGQGGEAIFLEEKIVRWPERDKAYTAFALETHSCTVLGHESIGWMQYGKADYLLYCFVQKNGDLICYLIAFQKLQRWFWKRHESFPKFYNADTLNKSQGRVVPIKDVRAAVPTWRRYLEAA